MANTLTSSVKASFDWLWQCPLDLTTVVDNSSLAFSQDLSDGTGSTANDRLWSDTITLAGAASTTLDLTALTNTLYGSTLTITFVNVKAILIVNTNTVSGDFLWLDSSVANAYLGPFKGATTSATSKVRIGPNSPTLLANIVDGFGTITTDVAVKITNGHATHSIVYSIAILGTSA